MAERQINALLKTLQAYESAPVTRSQAKAAESRPPPPPLPPFTPTPLESLFLDGMNSEQVWEQLELKTKNVLKVLEAIVTPEPPAKDDESEAGEEGEVRGDVRAVGLGGLALVEVVDGHGGERGGVEEVREVGE